MIESSSELAKSRKLKDVCRTRLIERIDSYLAFQDLYSFIVTTMEGISSRVVDYGDWSWDLDTVTKSNGFLRQITHFEFLVSFSIAMRLLSSLRGLVHRLNISADSPEACYRRNIMIPFLDHILVEMEERFGGTHQKIVKLLGLIPSVSVASIDDVGKVYECDLPSPHLLNLEFRRWKA